MRTPTLRLSVLAALAAGAVVASAAPVSLLPNSLVTPVPQTNDFGLIGTPVFSSQSTFTGRDVENTVLFTGTLTSSVYRQADNTLAFVYSVLNNAGSVDSIERVSFSSFNGFTTAVEQGTPLAGFTPASSATRSFNGNVVSFGYAPGTATGAIMPGVESRYVVVYTNATEFGTGSGQFIAGGVGTAVANVPSAVPEPATLAALGLGAAAMLRRRRKNA